jgi:hypothetical protein
LKTESRKGKTKTAFKKKQKNRSANQVLTLLIAARLVPSRSPGKCKSWMESLPFGSPVSWQRPTATAPTDFV